MATTIPIDLNKFEVGSVAVIQRVVDYLADERGVHIETAIACVGSLSGIAILRATNVPLPISQPDTVQMVLSEEVNARGSAVIAFMSQVAPNLGLDTSFEQIDIPEGHQPKWMMVQGVLEWGRDLEDVCNEILDEFEIESLQRPYAYAYAALKLVVGGEELVDQAVGKSLVMSAMVAGSKTAPYEKPL